MTIGLIRRRTAQGAPPPRSAVPCYRSETRLFHRYRLPEIRLFHRYQLPEIHLFHCSIAMAGRRRSHRRAFASQEIPPVASQETSPVEEENKSSGGGALPGNDVGTVETVELSDIEPVNVEELLEVGRVVLVDEEDEGGEQPVAVDDGNNDDDVLFLAEFPLGVNGAALEGSPHKAQRLEDMLEGDNYCLICLHHFCVGCGNQLSDTSDEDDGQHCN